MVGRSAPELPGYNTTISEAVPRFRVPMGGFARETYDSHTGDAHESSSSSCFLITAIREESTQTCLIWVDSTESLSPHSMDRSTQTADFDSEEDGEDGVPRGSTNARSRFKTFVRSRSKRVFESLRQASCRLPKLLEGPHRRPWESELAFSARAFKGQGMWRDLRRRVKNLFYL